MSWTFDRILARTERAVAPSDHAVIHGERILTWGALTARSNSLAAGLLAQGAAPGDKVAHYLRNGPEYIETSVACFKTGMVHVNVNYRYTANELFYLFDNADAAVIVYDRDFAPRVAELRERLGKVKLFIEVGSGAPENDFAVPYESLSAGAYHLVPPAMPDDPLLFIYTGGTTGMPKGVMWRHEDLWAALGGVVADLDVFEADLRAGKRGARALICPPLMHGAGYMIALLHLLRGGTVLMAAGAGFDAQAVLGMIDTHRPQLMLIVGDAFGRPLANALAAPARDYDLSALQAVISSGAAWSAGVKDALISAMPGLRCLDALGSSEVVGLGVNVHTGGALRFKSDAMTRVIADDGSLVQPGSGVSGRIARAGPVPLGYYKDPEKTARTFVVIGGVRHALPGDYATVEADGTIKLLGRGNMVVNSGGEKIFVEEIEEALKKHGAVQDALVFGLADPVWGQAVTAVVEASGVSAEDLREFLAAGLARYKLPKRIVFVGKVPRGPNGKADYAAAVELTKGEQG